MNEMKHRLWQILGTVEKEDFYLRSVISRLFPQAGPLGADQLQQLLDTPDGIDRLESFVGKFSRMQDTLVDKLLPAFLLAVGEEPGTALDNLLRAEKLGIVSHADAWLAMRHLRNRLVHEYVDDPLELAAALEKARSLSEELFRAHGFIRGYALKTLPLDQGAE